ncbi:uncharacterized protein LOC123535913 isoform X2 [Mercenaria mercenaria]|uniref:uncharacterized protein LOC123535913 isoform X2 n=1 Tax=Mercenaria mercenaria TaxID=6596 RepID=UPI00234F3086|nr:uncharacterized protein LOC123535913 isoform X2 [Mercenaria mercenaria]
MECSYLVYGRLRFLLLLMVLIPDVSSLTISVYQTADKAVLGDNPFTLSCTYTMGSLDMLYSIELMRKRESDSDFTTIVLFQNTSSPLNVTYTDSSLESRTVATKPTADSRTATLVFNRVECDDKATYKWKAFYSDGTNKNVEKTSTFTVKAKTLFGQQEHRSLSYVTNLEEGDNVVFTCSGDVGNEPVGHLVWFYYLYNDTSNAINASCNATSTAPVYQSSTCSYTRTSNLQLKMTRDFNNLIVRCTVQQDKYDQFGDGNVQTENIPVYYAPRISTIPNTTINEGQDIYAICDADSYPAPVYRWLLADGSVIRGPYLVLASPTVEDTGLYTCIVYNTYKSENHTVKRITFIQILKTPATMTSTMISTHVQKSSSDDAEKSTDTAAFIGVGVGTCVFTLIVVGSVLVVTRYIRGRQKHIQNDGNGLKKHIGRETSNVSCEVGVQTGYHIYYNDHRIQGSVRDYENPVQYDKLDDCKREDYQYTGLQSNYEELNDAKREANAYTIIMESTSRN